MPTHPVNISYTLINTPYLAIFFQFLVPEVEHFTSFISIIYLQEPDAAWNFEYSVGVGLSLRCVSVWVKVFESSSSRKSPGIYVSQNKALESSSLKEPPGIQVSQSSLPKGLFITSKLKQLIHTTLQKFHKSRKWFKILQSISLLSTYMTYYKMEDKTGGLYAY